MPRSPIKTTTIADFGGGWNVADSDLNLSSRYQPVSDNVLRGINGSLFARWGHQLFVDFRDGVAHTTNVVSVAYSVASGSPYITLTKTAHGYVTGQHIEIPDTATLATGTLGDIPISDLFGKHGLIVVDANTFKFAVRTAADSSTTGTLAMSSWVTDNHTLTGNILHMQYFKQHMVVFDDIGEVGTFDDNDGSVARIWDASKSDALSAGVPASRHCDAVSSTTFKSTLISCNGFDKDKPLQIDEDFNCGYLEDKSTFSNSAVPRADYVLGMQGYVIFIRTEYGDPFIELSAKNTDGTFTREVDPSDAVEVDLSMTTDTVDPVLLGAGPFRDKLFVAFYDRGMIGTLGIYDADGNHTPQFNDTIAENGTISHRTIVPLGNDIFMADYAGVPSVSISGVSGGFVPVRLSELIAPEISKHLASLSEDTLKRRAFALFNKNDRMYMLFLPKCDETPQTLFEDPFVFNDALKALNQALVFAPGHKLFDQSSILIEGAVDIGSLSASDINGFRKVVTIVNQDTFVIQLGGAPNATGIVAGGGVSVVLTPVDDETICYGFEYNKELKIRRWTRLRGMQWSCGASTQRGRVFFAYQGKVYRYGNSEEPLYADFVGEYDNASWSNSFHYPVGTRVYDSIDGNVYICLVDHDSPSTGTFAQYRSNTIDVWQQYVGEVINWAVETPWSDFSIRSAKKRIKYVGHDTEGYDEFTFSIFSNQVYRDPQSYALTPSRQMQFSAGGVGGYGMVNPAGWGAGRRTREEKVWPMPVDAKLFKLRYEGATTKRVQIIATTMYYQEGNIR